jgi:hypothetical protein
VRLGLLGRRPYGVGRRLAGAVTGLGNVSDEAPGGGDRDLDRLGVGGEGVGGAAGDALGEAVALGEAMVGGPHGDRERRGLAGRDRLGLLVRLRWLARRNPSLTTLDVPSGATSSSST